MPQTAPNPIHSPYEFFLGGGDLEMVTIRELLAAHVPAEQIHDKSLSWGAVASAYAAEIENAVAMQRQPVLIELKADIDLPPNAVLVDHHDDRAGSAQPTSLEQTFAILQLPQEFWTRWHTLVAANDRGFVTELTKKGATTDEILQIRAADRNAQGVTAEQESQSRQAAESREIKANGRLAIVRQPHDRSSPVCDALDSRLGGPGYETLMVVGPSTVNVFGDWSTIESLAEQFPSGWSGGARPNRGFWGCEIDAAPVESFLCQHLSKTGTSPSESPTATDSN